MTPQNNSEVFASALLTHGLLSIRAGKKSLRSAAKYAAQGGIALLCSSAAFSAFKKQKPFSATAYALIGALGIYAINQLKTEEQSGE
ncbi:MAG: hypothetical protein LBN32_00745 [Helicobacteraceae bacterium]|jgi:hypothetical protein|nr:hypothetical protein [Helicobacteraceae bacterium]